MTNKTAKQAVAVLVGVGFAMQASAAPILDWTAADNVAGIGDTALAVGAGTDTVGTGEWIKNYTPGSAILSSSVDAGYTGNNIYGVLQTSSTNGSSAALDPAGSRTDQSTPGVWFGVDGNTPDNGTGVDTRGIAALISFDLDTAAGATETIDTMSIAWDDVDNVTLRFAIESAGAWYVSSENFVADGAAGVLDYAGGDWAALTVAGASDTSLMTAEGLTYNIGVGTLDNITSVGFFEEGGVVNSAARARVKFDSISATVIPEPATLGLIAFFGGAVLFIRRRLVI